MAETLFRNVLNLIEFLQNLWIIFNVSLFSFVTKPLEPISNGSTDGEYSVISVLKWLYFCSLSLCAASILVSNGTVSSKRWIVFLLLLMMTRSGLRLVTQMFGGIVPPADVENPSRSEYISKLALSRQFRI